MRSAAFRELHLGTQEVRIRHFHETLMALSRARSTHLSEAASAWVEIPVPLPEPGRSRGFHIGDRELLLCNVDGSAYVVDDRCPHARTPLSGGRLCGFVLECPLHGGKVDVRDGTPAAAPIRRPVATWRTRRTEDRIEVLLPVR